jgi:hypothetical protein
MDANAQAVLSVLQQYVQEPNVCLIVPHQARVLPTLTHATALQMLNVNPVSASTTTAQLSVLNPNNMESS